MSDLWDALGVIATAGGTAAAGFSWWAARTANKTASALALIEHERWRHEMTPRLDIAITPSGVGGQYADLRITFEGPAALDRLDSVEISIRDDGYTHRVEHGGGPTEEQVAVQIWGPYRFRPGVDEASADGRSVPGKPMELGSWRKLFLERTPAPPWDSDDYWRNRYGGEPVRLWVTCYRAGHDRPWIIACDVSLPAPDIPAQYAN